MNSAPQRPLGIQLCCRWKGGLGKDQRETVQVSVIFTSAQCPSRGSEPSLLVTHQEQPLCKRNFLRTQQCLEASSSRYCGSCCWELQAPVSLEGTIPSSSHPSSARDIMSQSCPFPRVHSGFLHGTQFPLDIHLCKPRGCSGSDSSRTILG